MRALISKLKLFEENFIKHIQFLSGTFINQHFQLSMEYAVISRNSPNTEAEYGTLSSLLNGIFHMGVPKSKVFTM